MLGLFVCRFGLGLPILIMKNLSEMWYEKKVFY